MLVSTYTSKFTSIFGVVPFARSRVSFLAQFWPYAARRIFTLFFIVFPFASISELTKAILIVHTYSFLHFHSFSEDKKLLVF
jgi:hypothetical protein